MRKILLLFCAFAIYSATTIYGQTALPGTIEVETGNISNNSSHATRNKVGSGNGGTNNIIQQFRRDGGKDGTIINHVSIAADGNYDFEFTYFKNKAVASNVTINSTNSSGGSSVQLASLTIVDNSATATTSSYGTVKVLNVPLTTSIEYITIVTSSTTNSDIDLDNVIVTTSAAAPVITLLGDATVVVEQGDTYTDAGATAVDGSGNNITGSIVIVNPVDVNTIGAYTITYNVTSGGDAAAEVTRTVNVIAPQTIATQNGNWNDTATWGGDPVPTASDDVMIPDNMVVTVTDAQAAKSLKVTDAANVLINSGGALSITADVFLGRFDGGLVVQSQTSAEAMGTLTIGGSVQTLNGDDLTTATSDKRLLVRKTLTNDNWYLLSSMSSTQPRVNRMTDSDFRTNATPAFAIGVYNNANAVNSKYSYFSTTLTNADEVPLGAGMSVSVNGTGNGDTTGEFEYKAFFTHGSSVDIAIDTDAGTSDSFNLVGNPFLSNLYGNTNANATNVLSQNTGVLEEATLWFWNDATSAWVTKNQSSAAFTIAPVTGFFVKSSVAGGNFTFTKSMETHTATGSTLAKSANNRFEINLFIAKGKLKTETAVRFIENMTTSFDNGYDSSMFGGFASELEVYTGLVEGGSAKKLAIQSLPTQNFEDMIIPVGVTADANSEITFTSEALNVPTGYKVFLEDRVKNTFTRLDEVDAKYAATVAEKSTEGRFYLHVRSSALSTDTELLNSVSIYKADASTLRIVGLSQETANVKIYNVLGKQVMNSNFKANGVQEISLPKLSAGVYIVQLETETGKLNKKIVLE